VSTDGGDLGPNGGDHGGEIRETTTRVRGTSRARGSITMKTPSFTALDRELMFLVAGGASRVTGRSGAASDEVKRMLTDVTSSIKDLAKTSSSSTDPSMMMMMVMMMGGRGGGGGGAPAMAAPPAPPKPLVNISNSIA
jgi:hypothetical protein